MSAKKRKKKKKKRKLLKLHSCKTYILDINYQLCLQLMFFSESFTVLLENDW